jgi:DNA repair protein RecO
MALVKSTGIVLRTYMLGETSKVVVCYTRDHGKVRLVAKGARKGGGRFGAALEPFTVSGVVFYLRPGRGLSLLSQAEIVRDFPAIRRDVVRQSYAGAVVELLDLLVADQSPDPALFDLAEHVLQVVAEVSPGGLDPALWRFELRLASRPSFRPASRAAAPPRTARGSRRSRAASCAGSAEQARGGAPSAARRSTFSAGSRARRRKSSISMTSIGTR